MVRSRNKRKQASDSEAEPSKKRRPLADVGTNRQPAKTSTKSKASKSNSPRVVKSTSAKSRAIPTKPSASSFSDAKAQIRRKTNELRKEFKSFQAQQAPTKTPQPLKEPLPLVEENPVFTQAQSMLKELRDTVERYRYINNQPLTKRPTEKARWQQDSKDLHALNKIVHHGLVDVINTYVVPDAGQRATFANNEPERLELNSIARDIVGEIQPADMEQTWGSCAYDMLKGLAGILKPLPEPPE